MNFPFSRSLATIIILPFLAITGIAIVDLLISGNVRFDQNIALLVIFLFPASWLGYGLLDKHSQFASLDKVPFKQRLIRLPFSSFNCLFIFSIASIFIFLGVATIFGDMNLRKGLPMLIISYIVFIGTAILYEHPRIWFSDSFNLIDLLDKVQAIPQEDQRMYLDGIFSYEETGFTIDIENVKTKILWEEITLIRTYKVDLQSVDCIVIEVLFKDTHFSINDQTAGHMKFMENAAKKLLNFKEDWFITVAFPAFEKNLTTVYEKK